MLLEMAAVNTWRTGDFLDIVFFFGGGGVCDGLLRILSLSRSTVKPLNLVSLHVF